MGAKRRDPKRAGHAPRHVKVEDLAPLPRSFYEGEVLDIAEAMIGTVLVHRSPEGVVAARIVESEAYRGPEDLAAHSSGGRRTKRTEVMFGPPGRAYMFLLYGMHWAFNAVVADEGTPHAVLVRAVEPVLGVKLMAARRAARPDDVKLTNGPGKVCAALGLDAQAYGLDLCGTELFLAAGPRGEVGCSARINIDYAGEWAQKPWRFYEKGNRYVSVPPRD
ncbi:DNA-3-methyladenine glycosylase II [Minicystis rosea]|nr:DNA-3-methyladenine glycosylase II [Minicystis rosea]